MEQRYSEIPFVVSLSRDDAEAYYRRLLDQRQRSAFSIHSFFSRGAYQQLLHLTQEVVGSWGGPAVRVIYTDHDNVGVVEASRVDCIRKLHVLLQYTKEDLIIGDVEERCGLCIEMNYVLPTGDSRSRGFYELSSWDSELTHRGVKIDY